MNTPEQNANAVSELVFGLFIYAILIFIMGKQVRNSEVKS